MLGSVAKVQFMAVTEDRKIEPGLIRASGTTILSWYAGQLRLAK